MLYKNFGEETVTLPLKETEERMEIGKKEMKGFVVDNIFYSATQGEIHFASFFPKDYTVDKEYALYIALPGWEGLYFQGIGANSMEPYPFEAQKYCKDMIILSPQLNDWGEKSADDTIALVQYFLEQYNIDKKRVYLSTYWVKERHFLLY